MVLATDTVMATPTPSSGNVLGHESGKSMENRTEAGDFESSEEKNVTRIEPLSPPRSNLKKFVPGKTRSTANTSTKTTSTTSTSTTTTSTTTKIHFMDKLTSGNGRWRQVKTVGMDDFLKAEGGSWIYRSLASSAVPDFIYTKEGEK